MVTLISIRPHQKLWSISSESVDINLLYYVLVRCDLYSKLEGVAIEKSNRATLINDVSTSSDVIVK